VKSAPSAGDSPTGLRDSFVARLPFPLDRFQVEALDALDRGDSVVVAAPTGSGKTLVAEYAVELALAGGAKAFYTTPLKALSNQKYGDFFRRYGGARVGLLTGDNSLNGTAQVVVMTTEVLRNMIYAGSDTLAGLRYVVLDEVHYLQDPYRGSVWEEVIVHLPHDVDLVCLSATVSNAEELADWVRTVRGSTAAVIEDHRPVPLEDLLLMGKKSNGQLLLLPTFAEGDPNPDAIELVRGTWPAWRGRRAPVFAPKRAETVELLQQRRMLPGIYFVFSRAGCEEAVRQCLRESPALTNAEERRQIRSIVHAATASLPDGDLRTLDYGPWLAGLEAGYAAHHAGLVPPFKEAVERCFAAGLVKVVFATETLALGINMPARSVVIEKLVKFDGEKLAPLTPGEYTQLTGRAGRRGTDQVGFGVVSWSPGVDVARVAALAGARSYTLTSSFRPTYNMTANLVRRYSPEVARHLLNLSFAQYRADAEVVRLEAQLEKARQEEADARSKAQCERGDIWEYRATFRTGRHDKRAGADEPNVITALERLRPGDVFQAPGRRQASREVAVLSTTQRKRGDFVVRAVTARRRLISFGPGDFRSPPQVLRQIVVPGPFAPKSREFQRKLAAGLAMDGALRRRGDQPHGASTDGPGHALEACPDLRAHLQAAARAERAAKLVGRLERQLRSRRESVARQFDRVLALLEHRKYVKTASRSWALLEAGQRLARLYHDQDLLVAECMRQGLLEGLRPAEMAAVVSVFTFAPRGPSETTRDNLPNEKVRARWEAVQSAAWQLAAEEEELGLPTTRAPHPGFAAMAYGWARGKELGKLLGTGEEIGAGDFVRNAKQLIDLLRQLSDLLPDPVSAEMAGRAAAALFRGVVAASSSVDARA
jgi:ATP-dependent RNA helicase HelY